MNKDMNFNNGNGAIRRYDKGHAWECDKCGNILTIRCEAEDCCKKNLLNEEAQG